MLESGSRIEHQTWIRIWIQIRNKTFPTENYTAFQDLKIYRGINNAFDLLEPIETSSRTNKGYVGPNTPFGSIPDANEL
jgi:hypothetical protein